MPKGRDTYKAKIKRYLDDIGQQGSEISTTDKTKIGKMLFRLFVWQEVRREADLQLAAAFQQAVADKLIKDDDTLRRLDKGEHMQAESDTFTFVADVGDGRKLFDIEAFVLSVATKYKLDVAEVSKLAAVSYKPSKRTLSKKVLEID